jgi:hypothetical protein
MSTFSTNQHAPLLHQNPGRAPEVQQQQKQWGQELVLQGVPGAKACDNQRGQHGIDWLFIA